MLDALHGQEVQLGQLLPAKALLLASRIGETHRRELKGPWEASLDQGRLLGLSNLSLETFEVLSLIGGFGEGVGLASTKRGLVGLAHCVEVCSLKEHQRDFFIVLLITERELVQILLKL